DGDAKELSVEVVHVHNARVEGFCRHLVRVQLFDHALPSLIGDAGDAVPSLGQGLPQQAGCGDAAGQAAAHPDDRDRVPAGGGCSGHRIGPLATHTPAAPMTVNSTSVKCRSNIARRSTNRSPRLWKMLRPGWLEAACKRRASQLLWAWTSSAQSRVEPMNTPVSGRTRAASENAVCLWRSEAPGAQCRTWNIATDPTESSAS